MRILLETLAASAIAGAVLPTLISLVWLFSIGSFDIVEVLQHWLVVDTNAFIIGLTFIVVGPLKGNAI
jgi:hypothetical protein